MKSLLWLLVIGTVVGLSWYTIRAVGATRECYLTKQRDIEDLSYKLQSYGGNKVMMCTASYELVDSLGVCLASADTTLPVQLRVKLGPVVKNLLNVVRNGGKQLKGFQDAHDAVCSEYPDMMFAPPDYLVR